MMKAYNRIIMRLLLVLIVSMVWFEWNLLTDWGPHTEWPDGGPHVSGSPGRSRNPGSKAVDLVNVFIGTTNGGHVFPGATVPHGMVKAGMDTDSPGNHAGYDALSKFKVIGFSQLHDDGTGGNIPLSNFKLFPLADCPLESPSGHTNGAAGDRGAASASTFPNCRPRMHARKVARALRGDGMPDDAGSPGYFASNLSNNVRVEMTATRRTALHRYTFHPPSEVEPAEEPDTSSETGSAEGEHEAGGIELEKRRIYRLEGREAETPDNIQRGRRKGAIRKPPPPVVKEDEEAMDWQPRIVVDITNDGMGSGYNAMVNIQPKIGRVTGGADFRGSFGEGTYSAFVCVDFRSPTDLSKPLVPSEHGVYSGMNIIQNATFNPANAGGREIGALLAFSPSSPDLGSYSPRRPPTTDGGANPNTDSNSNSTSPWASTIILARVGVSLISTHQACASAEEEIPTFDFDAVQRAARGEWADLLGRVDVEVGEGAREVEEAALMYSSLYRSHIVPADYSGENPAWFSEEPYYDSLYCNWDTYRTLFPLMSIHDPYTYARIVRSFIDIQQNEGWLPECRDATLQQFIQGGTSADPILAEFYVKFQDHSEELGVVPEDLWAALIQDAEVQSPNWMLKGRQADPWKKHGFLPLAETKPVDGRLPYVSGGYNTRQVSRTLEYAFGDFAISQVARVMDKDEDLVKYLFRARGFENVWNPETPILDKNGTEVDGVLGFMQQRYGDGEWEYTDPRRCTVNDPGRHSCFLDRGNNDGFYEGGSIVYSQYVPHDTAKLIELQGGSEAFIRRLDYIFDNGYFDSTNEPSQQIPFMYHYANRPGLSTERSRETIKSSYNTSVNGLPGNDDSGAMGSYVVFNMLGLYPLPATRQLLVSSPFFRRVTFMNPLLNTRTTIYARDLDPERGVIYVNKIFIDGEEWYSRCFIEWDVFESGSIIELELTDDRTVACGEDYTALPPSMSTGAYS